MAPQKIFIISGPSGSGKTTLYKRLLSDPRMKKYLAKAVSMTTRERRPGEKNGVDYVYVSREMFEYKRRAGHFLEFEKVFGNYYGTTKSGIKKLLRSGKSALLCKDVKGARTLKRQFPHAVTIFIKPPTLEALKSRLKQRGSEKPEAVAVRLKRVSMEMRQAKWFDHVVINKDLNKAYRDLSLLVSQELAQPAI